MNQTIKTRVKKIKNGTNGPLQFTQTSTPIIDNFICPIAVRVFQD